MASNRIKGITIEIGGDTTKLDKALKGVDSNLWTIQKDLKAVENHLKIDPTNTELLVQKQRLLAETVEESGKRYELLSKAVKEAGNALAEGKINTQQYKNLNLELDLEAARFKEAEQALSDFNAELNDSGSAVAGAAKGIKKVGDAAGDAADGFGGLGEFSRGASSALGLTDVAAAGAAFTIGQKLVEAIVECVKWMWSFDESTQEFREEMGKLNTAFEAAGYGVEKAREVYQGLYDILGDTGKATEASQLLANLARNEEDMARWTEIAAGAYGTFGDALPIEGLIEAANETAKTGKVTGVLADALNWAGISEDDFNDTLSKNIDVSNRAELIMDTLTNTYKDAADAFYKNNEAIIANREAQSQLNEKSAELGQSVADVKAALDEAFGPALELLLTVAAGAFENLLGPIAAIGDAVQGLIDGFRNAINWLRKLVGQKDEWDEHWNLVQPGKIPVENYFPQSASFMSPASAQGLPHLARGAVTRVNSPYLAVVGDNPTEPEIIAPESAIQKAVSRGMAAAGGGRSGPMSVNITFTGDLAQLGRILNPVITTEGQRLGPKLVN